MKRLKDIKIQNKLFLVFGTLISLLIILAVFSGMQLYKVTNKYSGLISATIGRQSSISKAIADMGRIYYINLTKGYLVTVNADEEEIADLYENNSKYADLLIEHLVDYRSKVIDDIYLNEAEIQERLQTLDEVVYLFTAEYQPKIKELDASLYSNAPEMDRIIGETLQLGNQIIDKMDTLYSMVSITAERVSEETAVNSRETILLLTAIAVLFIILSIVVSLFMTKLIRVPIVRMKNAMQEISKGNLAYPIRSDRNDELGMLANQISDMVDSIAEMNKVMTVMANLDSMVLVIDFDFNLIYINQSLADAFGLDINNYKGKKCHMALRNNGLPCSICYLQGLLPDKDSFPSRDYEFLYDESLDAWIGGKAAIIRWVDGSMVYFQSIKDETEKKKNQEQLSEAMEAAKLASNAKSAFLANMSHELRTPLNVVVGLADLQLEDHKLPEDIRENLYKISNAGKTLLSIVNEILDVSKIESGNFMLTPVEYHMASLLNDTAILVTTRIGEKPLTFKLNVNEDLPSKLYGDDLRVKQILYNLLSNAIKYTQKGSVELEVHCAREGDSNVWMEINVKDTGIGIRPEDVKNLFAAYNQVDVKANRKIEGTGLGLTITKRLVECMDGEISVTSEYGQGSVFSVRLRQGFVSETTIGSLVVENLRKFRYSENKRHLVHTLVRPDLSYAKVLVVDDLQANLDVAAGLMRKYKMQVHCVTSGQAAIERIKLGEPVYSAIFMDHMMPEMDGIEAAEKIRALDTKYARNIPIIALTANAVVGTEELFYKHGFQAFITKPIDIMRLDSVIQEWVKDKSKDNTEKNTGDSSQNDTPVAVALAPGSLAEKDPIIEIPGLNASKGLAVCDGDFKIYQSTLRSYIADISIIIEKIREVTEDTLPDYAIAVHGIKGSSANIGAEAIRGAAANLEDMAKNGDLLGILEKNDTFLQETARMIAAIKDWLLKQADKIIKPRLPAPDSALLARLRQSCEEYDMDAIDKAMDELDSANYDSDNDLVAWLREKVDMFDFSEVAERLAEYRNI